MQYTLKEVADCIASNTKGYCVAGSDGSDEKIIGETVTMGSVGVLYKNPAAKPERALFGIVTIPVRPVFIGTLSIHDSVCLEFRVTGMAAHTLAQRLGEEKEIRENHLLVYQDGRVG